MNAKDKCRVKFQLQNALVSILFLLVSLNSSHSVSGMIVSFALFEIGFIYLYWVLSHFPPKERRKSPRQINGECGGHRHAG